MTQAATQRFVEVDRVRQRFSKIAPIYAQGDFFAREIDRRMQERLDFVRIDPQRLIDLGCSRGASLPDLAARYPGALQIAVDFSEGMLAPLRPADGGWKRWLGLKEKTSILPVAGDANALPLAARSTDLIWSNLMLHWLNDPLPALQEAHRVLEVGGLLMFSALGPDSLKELRGVFSDGYAHTQRFVDMHDYGDMLVHCGFADPVMDMEVLTLTYDDLDALFLELRSAGSMCAMTARRHGLTGRKRWENLRRGYDALRQDGKLPATFEVIYGHAWKAAPKQAADGRAIVRFDRQPRR